MESIQELWNSVLQILHEGNDISEPAFEMWIGCMEPRAIEDNSILVYVNTAFQKSIIEQQYMDKLLNAIELVLGFPLKLKIICGDSLPDTDSDPLATLSYSKTIDSEYTFDNFIVGSSNKFAHAAAQAVVKKPAGYYNPLFIHGGSGLGKTHLLHAICNALRANNPSISILYITGEVFTNEMIESLRNSSMPLFRMKYREPDILLMDDIQFIAGKEAIQEEFFHTFDYLYQAHKQIVLTSDRPPKEIATLEDRLRTRFEMGLIADIQPPDLETRILIIKRKAEQMDLNIQTDVCEYIANQLKNNVRQLEGVIKKMRAQYLLAGELPNLSSAQNAIRDIRNDDQPVPITVERIINEVARTMSVKPEDLRSGKHSAPVSRARHVAAYVVRSITGLSMKSIGSEFGGRDHSTIVYALQKVEDQMEHDPSFRNMVNDIIKNIGEN